jgi:hypothetical protein
MSFLKEAFPELVANQVRESTVCRDLNFDLTNSSIMETFDKYVEAGNNENARVIQKIIKENIAFTYYLALFINNKNLRNKYSKNKYHSFRNASFNVTFSRINTIQLNYSYSNRIHYFTITFPNNFVNTTNINYPFPIDWLDSSGTRYPFLKMDRAFFVESIYFILSSICMFCYDNLIKENECYNLPYVDLTSNLNNWSFDRENPVYHNLFISCRNIIEKNLITPSYYLVQDTTNPLVFNVNNFNTCNSIAPTSAAWAPFLIGGLYPDRDSLVQNFYNVYSILDEKVLFDISQGNNLFSIATVNQLQININNNYYLEFSKKAKTFETVATRSIIGTTSYNLVVTGMPRSYYDYYLLEFFINTKIIYNYSQIIPSTYSLIPTSNLDKHIVNISGFTKPENKWQRDATNLLNYLSKKNSDPYSNLWSRTDVNYFSKLWWYLDDRKNAFEFILSTTVDKNKSELNDFFRW